MTKALSPAEGGKPKAKRATKADARDGKPPRKAKRKFEGVLKKSLVRLSPQYGDAPGSGVGILGGLHGRGIINHGEMEAARARQEWDKLPAACEDNGVVHGSAGWELGLALALARRVYPGFRYPRGRKPKATDQRQYDLAQDEFREIVRILALNEPPHKEIGDKDDGEFTWAIRKYARETGKSFEVVNGRFHKIGAENKRSLKALGAPWLNLLRIGALNGFYHVGRNLTKPMSALEAAGGILGGALGILGGAVLIPDHTPVLIHIIYDPRFPLFARELCRNLEKGRCLVRLVPIEPQPMSLLPELPGLPKELPSLPRKHEFTEAQKVAMRQEAERYSARTFLLDSGNMETAAALSEAFAAGGIISTTDSTARKLPGVGVYHPTGPFAGLPTPAIVTLALKTPKAVREFTGKPAPYLSSWFGQLDR